MEDDIAIGIDLGTTNSLVAVFRDGRVEIVENEFGTLTMPSYVAFSQHERLIGKLAQNLVVDEPENTVYDVKQLIGIRFDDHRIQDKIGQTFNLRKDGEMTKIVFCEEQLEFRPEEISAIILKRLKEMAENYLQERVTKAVISVPANFNDSQRQATIKAGNIAGLEVLAIIDEPTAAALCYRMKKKSSPINNTVLIFDLGGGTFDVSVVSINDGKFTVKSTAGDCYLGGNDFDNALMDHCLDSFWTQYLLDPSTDKCAIQRLRVECERAKIRLSTSNQTTIKVNYLFKQRHFSLTIVRTQFENLCKKHFVRIMSLVNDVVRKANIEQIDDIVLVGGSTRIPIIRQLLQNYFGLKEIRYKSINPDQAVVNGAAIHAAILNCQNNCPNFSLCPNFRQCASQHTDTAPNEIYRHCASRHTDTAPNEIYRHCASRHTDTAPNEIYRHCASRHTDTAPNEIYRHCASRHTDTAPNEINRHCASRHTDTAPNEIYRHCASRHTDTAPNEINRHCASRHTDTAPNEINRHCAVQHTDTAPNEINRHCAVQHTDTAPNEINRHCAVQHTDTAPNGINRQCASQHTDTAPNEINRQCASQHTDTAPNGINRQCASQHTDTAPNGINRQCASQHTDTAPNGIH